MGDVLWRPDQYGQGFPNNEALYIDQIKALEETVKRLNDEKKGLIKRSEHITRFMAKNAQGMKGLENLNDPHSNTKLAERFERIFLDLWTEMLIHEQQKTELQTIKWLSSLMKKAHDKCVSLAEDKIRDFCFLNRDDSLPTRSDHPDIYNERANFGRRDEARKAVKQIILGERFLTELTNDEKADEHLKNFLDEFVECCWLMLVSAKPFVFTFDVADQVLEGELERKFSVYCSMKDYKDKTKKNGHIVGLVWPEIDDKDGTQKKGKVLAIDNEDSDTDEADASGNENKNKLGKSDGPKEPKAPKMNRQLTNESEGENTNDKKDNKDGEMCSASDKPDKPTPLPMEVETEIL